MKPRLLLNLAAGISLLLAVAIIVLWIRSYGRREGIGRAWHTATEDCIWGLESGYSSVSLSTMRIPQTAPVIAARYQYYDHTRGDSQTMHVQYHWFAFPPLHFVHQSAPRYPFDATGVAIAYWLLLPPTLILPTIAIARHRRRRRREAGNLCPTCGYDLRAHNAGDRCPECGMVPARARRLAR